MNKLYRLHTKWPQRKARVSREKKDLVFLIDPFQCWFIQHQLVSSSSIQNYKPHSVLKSNKLVYSCIHFLAPRQNPGTNAFRHLFQCLTTSPLSPQHFQNFSGKNPCCCFVQTTTVLTVSHDKTCDY